MLEIGRRARSAAERGGVEEAAAKSNDGEGRKPRSRLEAARPNVVMGHGVLNTVQREAERDRRPARACERAGGRARGDVHRDDHSAV
jgi:hypothetical protein